MQQPEISILHRSLFKNLLLIILIALCNSIASAKPEHGTVEWSAFEKKVTALRVEKQIPGLAIGVVKDGELAWSIGLGYADSNRTIPVTSDTPFWIASVTKTFVALAYLHLEAQGSVNFEELASKTPDFDGLCSWLSGTSIPFAKGLNCEAPIKIKHILHHQVNDIPGTQFMYNPIMYSRLSRHLEHKFGEGINAVEGRHNYLGQIIDTFILAPAKMERTMSSMWDRRKLPVFFDLADGFKVDEQGNKTKMPRPDKHIAGGAGIVSTIRDLAKYDIAISDNTIAPSNIKEKLLNTAMFNDGAAAPYGFGWYFQCYRGEKLMWHGGWDPDAGYSALHLRIPDKGLALIALANSEGLWWGNPLTQAQVESSPLASLFLDQFLPEPHISEIDNQCDLSNRVGEKYH